MHISVLLTQASVTPVALFWGSSYRGLNLRIGILHLTSISGLQVGRDPDPQALDACYPDISM